MKESDEHAPWLRVLGLGKVTPFTSNPTRGGYELHGGPQNIGPYALRTHLGSLSIMVVLVPKSVLVRLLTENHPQRLNVT